MAGRPALFKSPDELDELISNYFEDEKKPTITGLCLFLGFESRQSFYAYENKPEFSYTIKKARTRIENTYEKMLHTNNVTGAIFALKNFGWLDKTEVEHSGGVTINLVRKEPENE